MKNNIGTVTIPEHVLRCPYCRAKENHIRWTDNKGKPIVRHRVCKKCGKHFNTVEVDEK